MNRIPLYVGLIAGVAGVFNAMRRWPAGVPWNEPEFLAASAVEVLTMAGLAALIAWLVTRNRVGNR